MLGAEILVFSGAMGAAAANGLIARTGKAFGHLPVAKQSGGFTAVDAAFRLLARTADNGVPAVGELDSGAHHQARPIGLDKASKAD